MIGKATNINTDPDTFGIDVASDSGLSGMAIGSLTADASSTAGAAIATAGAADSAIGAVLPSLNVGGISDLTGAAQLDSSATASNVGGVDANAATAKAGQGQSVVGLTSGETTINSVDGSGGTVISFQDGKTNYSGALDKANDQDGWVATITSAEDQEALQDAMPTTGSGWIGADDIKTEGIGNGLTDQK